MTPVPTTAKGSRPVVLVVRTGAPGLAAQAVVGGFGAWFGRLLTAAGAAVSEVDGVAGALPAPGAGAPAGVVVTGSMASVTRLEPWMERLGTWLLETARTTPVLGVCFGHQLLAHALGGRVERNPLGPECGTTELALTEAGRADPLFAGLPARFLAQQAHEDHVPEPPPGAVVLAGNAHSPVQAFAHGPRLRAVQFHPEFDAFRSRLLCEEDHPMLEAARPGLGDAALASIQPTPEAERVLAAWVDGYVRGARR